MSRGVKTATMAASIAMLITAAVVVDATQAEGGQPGTRRTPLQQAGLSIAGREVIQVRVDFDPGFVAPWHTHPGEEVIYVLEGTIEYQVQGKPPKTYKAGQVLVVPYGTPHSARNVGA